MLVNLCDRQMRPETICGLSCNVHKLVHEECAYIKKEAMSLNPCTGHYVDGHFITSVSVVKYTTD